MSLLPNLDAFADEIREGQEKLLFEIRVLQELLADLLAAQVGVSHSSLMSAARNRVRFND